MSNSLTASKKIMKNYLSELLTEPEVVQELSHQRIDKQINSKPLAHKETKSLENLLKTVSEEKENIVNKEVKIVDSLGVNLLPLSTDKSRAEVFELKDKNYRQGDFQAMFFDVAGLTIAVPLIELGGIHKVDKTTSLMGKPDWFKGVMLYRNEKINVVDTALWVMPEKCDEALKNSLNYQYIIMLNDSPWGLMAENLVDTLVLRQDEVKWLDTTNKRPWLAGLVKEKMCALLDVSALIQLLDKGNDIYQER
ncbi:chemotaxis protein CheW [Colwellia psychrerythraea]|uniref:CheW protein n=1 Tax=Colwellia psychrerythraea TaxID=28229 RepID=A0A099L2G1_COLPS|nr:chemotaxis protein CheW [Colwellia psychrerythraea]KGJ97046.1 CheW protein [Colwellia psychrerythraea]